MSELLVSIVIPCFNHGRFLRESIRSALDQSHPSIEVIVVDDGSTDSTPLVASDLGDQIVYVRQANAGLSAARNTGIAQARGAFLLFLDADDFLDREVVASHLVAAQASPSATLLVGSWRHVDTEGRVVQGVTNPEVKENALTTLLGGNVAPVMCVCVRREAFDRGHRFDTRLKSHEDWDLWLRLVGTGFEMALTPHGVVNYRGVPGSMSANVVRMYDTAQSVLRRSRPLRRRSLSCNQAWIGSRDAFASKLWLEHFLPQHAAARSRGERLRLLMLVAGRSLRDRWLARRLFRWYWSSLRASIRSLALRLPLLWRFVRSS